MPELKTCVCLLALCRPPRGESPRMCYIMQQHAKRHTQLKTLRTWHGMVDKCPTLLFVPIALTSIDVKNLNAIMSALVLMAYRNAGTMYLQHVQRPHPRYTS